MSKENSLEVLKALKILAVTDFEQLSDEEKEENEKYQKGYLDALNMAINHFQGM